MSNGNGAVTAQQTGLFSGISDFLGKLVGNHPTSSSVISREEQSPPLVRQEEVVESFPDPVVGNGVIQTPVVRTATPEGSVPEVVLNESEMVEVLAVPKVSPPIPVVPREEINLHSVLFRALQQAEPIKQDFRVGELIHELFIQSDLVYLVAQQLAASYADGEKKIGAVVGMGIYGDRLARAMQSYLPPMTGIDGNPHDVHSFPLDQRCQNGINVWGFASDNRVGQQLRAKRVLIVLPVLTRSTSEDVEACIRHIEDHLGTNTTVFGVVTVFALNHKKTISRTRGKPLVVNSLLTLGFNW